MALGAPFRKPSSLNLGGLQGSPPRQVKFSPAQGVVMNTAPASGVFGVSGHCAQQLSPKNKPSSALLRKGARSVQHRVLVVSSPNDALYPPERQTKVTDVALLGWG